MSFFRQSGTRGVTVRRERGWPEPFMRIEVVTTGQGTSYEQNELLKCKQRVFPYLCALLNGILDLGIKKEIKKRSIVFFLCPLVPSFLKLSHLSCSVGVTYLEEGAASSSCLRIRNMFKLNSGSCDYGGK